VNSLERRGKWLPLQPANKEAGMFLEGLVKRVFEAVDKRESKKQKAKKTSNKFSDLKNNLHLCSPPKGEKKREGKREEKA
jgi:hypothetical protein